MRARADRRRRRGARGGRARALGGEGNAWDRVRGSAREEEARRVAPEEDVAAAVTIEVADDAESAAVLCARDRGAEGAVALAGADRIVGDEVDLAVTGEVEEAAELELFGELHV